MSLNYLYDILIHFHTYKNIDLVNQGIYNIKTKISTNFNNKKYYAVPYYYVESKALENMNQTDEQTIKAHCVLSPSISEKNYEYTTKSFYIRYADEEVELDEFCYFKLEIPSNVNLNDIEMNIKFYIGFSDAFNNGTKEKKNGINILKDIKFKNLHLVTVSIINDNISKNFVESYSPIVYHDNFSSLLNVSIHRVLSDFKIRIAKNFFPFAIEEIKDNEDEKTNENNEDNNNNKNTNNNKNINKNNNKNNNLIQMSDISNFNSLINFFYDENTEIPSNISNNEIDILYNKYVLNLISSYFFLKKKLNKLTNKLIDENMKAEFSNFLNTQPLLIYYEDKEDKIIISNEEDIREIFNQIQNLSKRIKDTSKDFVGFRIFKEINYISSQIAYIWHKYIELIRNFPGPSNFILKLEFRKELKEGLFKFIEKETLTITDTNSLLFPLETNLQNLNMTSALDKRQNLTQTYKRPLIENSNFKINPQTFPILFEETYIKNLNQNTDKKSLIDSNILLIEKDESKLKENLEIKNNIKNYRNNQTLGLHLIILVHGFEGNSNDMRVIKNEIALINPSIVFLSSISNQDDTGIDLYQMGKNLASEVKNYIKEWNDGLIFKKISFIGHSIGGVIIRSALPYLKEFKEKLHLYISLSSPHLGYAFSDSKLIKTGMWFLKRWKNSKCLEQFLQNDNENYKETCIYKISEFEGLNWFNYVYLLSSHQDNYSPYGSSRIELSNNYSQNDKKTENYRKMAYNILSKISNNTLKRVDVNFVIQEKNFDSFIGRTAHIQFLENTDFMKIFFHNIENILK